MTRYASQYISRALKDTREERGMTQREVSESSGLTQSQISRIENGNLDPRLSSLVELARVLDLEPVLVPRKLVSTVQATIRTSRGTAMIDHDHRRRQRELESIRQLAAKLPSTPPLAEDVEALQRYVDEFRRFAPSVLDAEDLGAIRGALEAVGEALDRPTLRTATADLRSVRNRVLHRALDAQESEPARPVYALNGMDDLGDD